MRLFKYVATKDAAMAMARGSLKFAPVAELNDPMEILPFFDEAEVRKSLGRLRSNGCTDEQFRWLRHQKELLGRFAPALNSIRLPDDRETVSALYRLASDDMLPLLRSELVDSIRILRSNVGVLSLSERADCVPMWSHYASGATGFVVALDGIERCFPGDQTGSLNAAKPVVYSDRYLGMTFEPSSQDHLFFAKLDDWRYEREWRVVRALDQCRRHGPEGAALHLHDIDRDHVRAILCGWNVSDEDFHDVRDRVADVNPGAAVLRSAIDLGRIVFDAPLPPERNGTGAA